MENMLAKLTAALEAGGLSQARVARMTGISTGALSMFLSGQRKLRFEHVALIARAAGVSLDYLADDAAAEPPRVPGEAERWAVEFIQAKELTKKDVIVRLTSDPSAPPRLELEARPKDKSRRA